MTIHFKAAHQKLPPIKRISIRKLFGTYSYDINTPDSTDENPSLLLLYGDNGSGKTTILNLLYHLLSPISNGGHRTAIGNTRFQHFEVELNNGLTVEAMRKEGSIVGAFTQSIRRHSKPLASFTWPRSPRDVLSEHGEDDAHEKLCNVLSKLNLSYRHLSDDRRFLTSNDNAIETKQRRRLHREEGGEFIWDAPSKRGVRADAILATEAIQRATDWIRDQTLQATNSGQTQANNIVAEFIKNLAAFGQGNTSSTTEFNALASTLETLALRNESFRVFGLSPTLEISDIINSIKSAHPNNHAVVQHALRPYIETTEARLNALQPIRDLVDKLVENLDTFYSNKKVHFNLSSGLHIGFCTGAAEEHPLEIAHLSSGERQLLLLLCNAISSRDQSSVLVIDEPEISLNIKWQRRLIPALFDCLRGSNAQIILATHSLELISQYRSKIVKLENKPS